MAAAPQLSASAVTSSSIGLESCLEKNNSLAVLMLIDESRSLRELRSSSGEKLPGNDPLDSRVPALESVVRVMASAVESSALLANTSSKKLEVAIAISGFGDGYSERVAFQSLSSKSLESIISGLELQRDRDSDLHTRYHIALKGALESFEKYSTSPEVCRLLVWFSDGEHDDDNSPGFSSRERDQIQKDICGVGGTVDALRKGRVNIVAAGLNAEERKLGLMRLIAQGGAAYRPPDSNSVNVDRCGGEEPNGRYALAESADKIVDKLFEVLKPVPGIPGPDDAVEIPKSQAANCPKPANACNAIEFQVDESIASFQILAERPSEAVEVVLTTNEGQSYPVLAANMSDIKGAAISKNTVNTTPVTSRKVFVSVTRKKENSIEGTWRLEFLGEGASRSSGTVNFVGLADITLLNSAGQQVANEFKLSRFDAEDLGIRVSSKTSGSAIRLLKVEFSSFEGVEELRVDRSESDRGLFELLGSELERALQGPQLQKISSTDLRVQPIGDVPGLRFKNGTPVPIRFAVQTFPVRVSNGADLPSFVRAVGTLSFQGTPKQSIQLVFKGPDSGDGLIEFKEAIEQSGAKANLDLIPRGPCAVAQKSEVTCVIELIPDQEAFDQFQVAISVTYSGNDNLQRPVEGEVPVDVTMVLQPKASRGILAAIYLVVAFLIIQGLVRWLLAFLVSRFAPLVPIARRVRLDAVLDSSGSLSVNPMNLNPSHSDEGFALENTDSVQSFTLFGYEFSVSVLRTFLRSTVAPLGQVSYPGKYVIGSRGYVQSKDQFDHSIGQISLSLRGQWIVGVGAADLQRLINGESLVDAEVVAFLEPYEHGQGRDQQISELSFGLSASSFATHLAELIEDQRERMSEASDAEGESDGTSTGSVSGDGAIQFPSIDDPFGTTSSSRDSNAVSRSEPPESRGRRSRRESSGGSQSEQSGTSTEWDPFA